MYTHRQLQKIQMRRGWSVAIDGQQFRVIDNGFDEKYRRIYTLRDQGGGEQTVLRARVLEMISAGRARVTTPVETALIGIIDQIRDYAKRGYSMSGTAKALGLYDWDVRKAIKLCGADDIQFVKGTESVGFRENLKRLHASRRGVPVVQTPAMQAGLMRARAAQRERALHTAFGITGTIKELKAHFGSKVHESLIRARMKKAGMNIEQALTVPMAPNEQRMFFGAVPGLTQHQIDVAREYADNGHSVSRAAARLGISRGWLLERLKASGADIRFQGQHVTYTAFGVTGTVGALVRRFGSAVSAECVRYRMRKGMPIEEAMTREPLRAEKGVIPPQFVEQVEKDRRRRVIRIRDAIQRRLAPSMLQYRATEHDIVVTHQKAPHISVEVRTKCGTVLHRLRFAVAFDDGVLFAFDQNERGRLDFIAFEPDSQALISTH